MGRGSLKISFLNLKNDFQNWFLNFILIKEVE